ncbi:hypothetical protein AMJ83_10135 [candidate division WOR_3 bacterium SM23_42]|uniref:O-antigen ligase-related domain-containing protein n=1 Tax=candidate division WOR_3 bacterium SM23_42 TaxID=1703779 RepID=A0A0S8FPS2_UNCW3|nr:MAG: hypothetical protein AMJ83_10135 [candidate division WOR_3 bacterium SM23_42]
MTVFISPLIPVVIAVAALVIAVIKDYRIGTLIVVILAFTNVGGQQIFEAYHVFLLIIMLTAFSLTLAVLRGSVAVQGIKEFNILLAIFGTWSFLSGVIAIDHELWFGMIEYMIRAFLVLYLVYNSFSKGEEIFRLFKIIVFSMFLSSIISFFAMIGSLSLSVETLLSLFSTRFAGTIVDPNFYAMTIAGIIPLAFVLITEEKRIALKAFWIISVFFLMLTIVFSQSRTGIIAISIIFIYSLYNLMRKKRVEILFFIIPIIVILILIPPAFWFRMSVFVESLSSGARADTSVVHRLLLLRSALDVFLKNPIFGVGLGNFEAIAGRYTIDPMVCHNTYLEIASNLGLLGTVPFVLLLYRGFMLPKHSMQNPNVRELSWAVRTGLLGMYVAILFLSVPFKLDLWILLSIAAILGRKISSEKSP